MQTQNAHLKLQNMGPIVNIGPIAHGAAIKRRPSIAGQSVFIALAVLFLLAFLGAVFITVIARNIAHSARNTQTMNADYYAQAGINYANEMLMTSPQGADWRPPLQALLSSAAVQNMSKQQYSAYFTAVNAPAGTTPGTYNPAGGGTYNLPGVVAGGTEAQDPDAPWLAAGFTRYNVGNGRFLIRLSYVFDPDSGFPNNNTALATGIAKYIRIDSVGRFGTVDPTDPTTYANQPPTRLRAEMTAYKPIGLVDYARFITNKDNRTDTANLGVPSVNTAAGLATNPFTGNYVTSIFSATAPQPITSLQTTLVTPNVLDFDTNNLPNIRPYPIIASYGSPSGYTSFIPGSNIAIGGGSLRANCNLRLFGLNIAYLNPLIGDAWEVDGQLLFDRYNDAGVAANAAAHATNLANQQAQFDVISQTNGAANPTLYTTPGQATPGVFPSDDPFFTTVGGLLRDNGTSSDSNGFPRNVQRLDPPSLDTTDPGSGLTRYRTLTQVGAIAVNPGNPGTVYVSNTADTQSESQQIGTGGYTLRDEWLNRTGNSAINWLGDFYNPPGVVVRFGPIPNPTPPTTGNPQPYLMLSNGEPAWGITLTRSDKDANGNKIFWPQRDGSAGSSQTIYIVYAPLSSNVTANESPAPPNVANDPGYPYFFMNAENAPGATVTAGNATIPDPNNDITIFAEGNVRVSGMVSDPSTLNGNAAFQHVTIVTNGIGYIDGSILKGGPGYTVPTGPGASTNNYLSESSAALLAESYICVNTTQFLAGPPNFNTSTAPSPTTVGTTPAIPVFDFATSSESLTEPVLLVPAFDANNAPTEPQNLSLYISQFGTTGSQGQAEFIDQAGITEVAAAPTLLPTDGTTYGGTAANSNQTTVPIPGGFNGASPGFPAALENYQLTFSQVQPGGSTTDWDLEHAGIFPANARIEAILYAQNNSFFVIPGQWFNSNPSDSLTNFGGTGSPRNPAGGGDSDPNFQRFPFYGQPVDLQISIFGTVAENLPANLGDEAAWEQKWGWIPIYHGSMYTGNPQLNGASAETAPVRDSNYATTAPQVGLNMSYDPSDGFDMVNQGNSGMQYIRLDQFGRPLPVTPDLPVSTDLLYSGQSQTASLLP